MAERGNPVITQMSKRGAVTVALVALVGGSIATAGPTHAANTYVDNFDGTKVSGNATFQWNSGSDLGLLCSQNGTTVQMGIGVNAGGTGSASVKVAFANPSVVWDEVDGWVKKNGTTTTKVYQGDELTEVQLTPTISGAAAKNQQNVTGNPYVYYLDANGYWHDLGHCNQGKGAATVHLKDWTVEWSASNAGNVKKGSCFSNSTSSSANFHQVVGSLSFTSKDATSVIYSNKVLDLTNSKQPTMVSGSSWEYAPTSNGGTKDWQGFHVYVAGIEASVSTGNINLNKDYTQKDAHGIGGNPNIWIGLGPVGDMNHDFYLLGRCKSL